MKVEKWNPNLQTYDNDGNGAITINDLAFVNEAFDWNNTEEELERWIERRDFDGDEKVSEILEYVWMFLKKNCKMTWVDFKTWFLAQTFQL